MNRIDAIRARLGSIPPSRLAQLPGSVQRLLELDIPWLLAKIGDLKDEASPEGSSYCQTGPSAPRQ